MREKGSGKGKGRETETGLQPPVNTTTTTSDIATTVESEVMILSGIIAGVEIGAESGRIATGSAGTERRRRAVNISLQDVSSTRVKRVKATGATSTKRTSAAKRRRRPVMTASQREMNKMLRSNGPQLSFRRDLLLCEQHGI